MLLVCDAGALFRDCFITASLFQSFLQTLSIIETYSLKAATGYGWPYADEIKFAYSPVIYGNLQIFPVPTATPRADNKKPILDENRWFTLLSS